MRRPQRQPSKTLRLETLQAIETALERQHSQYVKTQRRLTWWQRTTQATRREVAAKYEGVCEVKPATDGEVKTERVVLRRELNMTTIRLDTLLESLLK